jgi:hypothetical protein
MRYRRSWIWGWALVDAVGLGCALLVWHPAAVAVSVTMTTAVAGLALVLLGTTLDPGCPVLTLAGWPELVRVAVATGSAAVATVLYVHVSWVVGGLLLVTAAFSSPWVLHLLVGTGGRRVPPAELSDAELCRAWRLSVVGLACSPTMAERLQIVSTREVLLDEMERRNPRLLQSWIASGARVSKTPSRYCGDGSHDSR